MLSPDEAIELWTRMGARRYRLSAREQDYVFAVMRGHTSYKEIADYLGVRLDTVHHMLARIYAKVDAADMTQMVCRLLGLSRAV